MWTKLKSLFFDSILQVLFFVSHNGFERYQKQYNYLLYKHQLRVSAKYTEYKLKNI